MVLIIERLHWTAGWELVTRNRTATFMIPNFIINVFLNIKKQFKAECSDFSYKRDDPIEMLAHHRSICVMKFISPI